MYMEIAEAGEDKFPAIILLGKIPVLSGQGREKTCGFSPDADKTAVFQGFKLSGRFTVNNIPCYYKVPLFHFSSRVFFFSSIHYYYMDRMQNMQIPSGRILKTR
jgi:hypothetical protein